MKKNISINISGIVFHVEEDGYEKLRDYLESIARYFAAYEDNQEILQDIEARIAEIFIRKQKNESKEVVSLTDVEDLMTTMGSISDFASMEEDFERQEKQQEEQRSAYNSTEDADYEEVPQPKKLLRDRKRKVLGGVAAGIANYFNTDPIWIRLFIIAIFFIDAFASLGIITIVLYIVCWIVIPGSDNLEAQETKYRKFFRDPERRTIGGVCAGLAAYLGLDITLVRLLFVISLFIGGTGLLLYIILWIITPEAQSLTERMQMQGEPLTLANIESSVKKKMTDEEGEESTLARVVLFPFRLVATILDNLGTALGPFLIFLGEMARIIAGILLILIGLGISLGLLAVAGTIAGLFSVDTYRMGVLDVPVDLFFNTIPEITLLSGLLLILIPAVGIFLGGLATLAKRRVASKSFGWTLLGIWFLSMILVSATAPPVVLAFQEEGSYTQTENFPVQEQTAIFTLEENRGNAINWDNVELTIRGYEGETYRLVKRFQARGNSTDNARENARMVTYLVNREDSIFYFPENYRFNDDAAFRVQELTMTLFVPFDQQFKMDRNLAEILRGTIYANGFRVSDMQDNTFQFTTEGMQCLTCSQRKNMDSAFEGSARFNQEFNYQNFNALNIEGNCQVSVNQADSFSINYINADDMGDVLRFEQQGEELQIYTVQSDTKPKVLITMPRLNSLIADGSVDLVLNKGSYETLNLVIEGAGRLNGNVQAEEIKLAITDAASAQLSGTVNQLIVNMEGSAALLASGLVAQTLEISGADAARAQLSVTSEINGSMNGSSKLVYSGDPAVNLQQNSNAQIEKK